MNPPEELWLWVKDFEEPVRVHPDHVDEWWVGQGWKKKLFREVNETTPRLS